MALQAQSSSLVTLLLLLFLITVMGNSIPKAGYENATTVSSSSSSSELKKVVNQIYGCTNVPWMCSQGEYPPRYLCCDNRCVDVTQDAYNCGICGYKCQFNLQCCGRRCVNINISLLNCGQCGRICPIGRFCILGTCAFQQPLQPQFSPEQKPPQPLPHQPLYPKEPPPMD